MKRLSSMDRVQIGSNFRLRWVLLNILAGSLGWPIARIILALNPGTTGTQNEEAVKTIGFAISLIATETIAGAIGGALIGLMQWLAFQRRLRRWMWLTALGVALGAGILSAVNYAVYLYQLNSLGGQGGIAIARVAASTNLSQAIQAIFATLNLTVPSTTVSMIADLIEMAGSGLLVGFAYLAGAGSMQALILRQHIYRAGWWWLANIIAGALGFALLTPISNIMFSVFRDAVPNDTISAILGIVVAGAIFGLVFGGITGSVLVRLWQRPRSLDESSTRSAPVLS